MNKLILASSSPRRKELLEQAKIPFKLRKQEVDESIIPIMEPANYVKELAKLKGESIPFENNQEIILSADTIVSYQGEILGKPANNQEAFEMLSMLSGQTHEVYTGVMLRSYEKESIFVEKTTVEFWQLLNQEIRDYISTGDPFDKAGAYGIQSGGSLFVKGISGDYYNVVGLPLSHVVRSLRTFGIYPQQS